MEIMVSNDKSLAELVVDLKVFPQTIQNVRVREKVPLKDVPAIQKVIAEAESDRDGNGRIVVRYSGTESLARVMVEAESEEKVRRVAATISDALRVHLGE